LKCSIQGKEFGGNQVAKVIVTIAERNVLERME
jgi:hypothetical protein